MGIDEHLAHYNVLSREGHPKFTPRRKPCFTTTTHTQEYYCTVQTNLKKKTNGSFFFFGEIREKKSLCYCHR